MLKSESESKILKRLKVKVKVKERVPTIEYNQVRFKNARKSTRRCGSLVETVETVETEDLLRLKYQ